MADKKIQELVERAIAEVFDSRMTELRQAVAARVAEQLAAAVPAKAAGSAELDAALASVHDAGAQADMLRAMLEGASLFAGRAALLVLRGNTLSGWQARGFADNDAIRSVSLDSTQGLAGRAVQDRTPAGAAAAEFSSDFVQKFGNPADGNALVLPLVVRDKVPAVLYADAGIDDVRFDASALQALVRSTGWWLEVVALRKSASPAAAEGESTQPIPAPAAMAASATAATPAPPIVSTPVVHAPPPAPPPPPVAAVAAPPAPAAAPPVPAAPAAAEEDELHKKAKRFAKLLVDEIKLYNQAKVAEGRKSKDLYDRLKDDIDKSRATYDKRYGNTPAAAANYFLGEVIRILADNDASLMGSNFPAT